MRALAGMSSHGVSRMSKTPDESAIPHSGRKNVKRDQENEELERKGRRQASNGPAKKHDPRGDRKPPQPFSGTSR